MSVRCTPSLSARKKSSRSPTIFYPNLLPKLPRQPIRHRPKPPPPPLPPPPRLSKQLPQPHLQLVRLFRRPPTTMRPILPRPLARRLNQRPILLPLVQHRIRNAQVLRGAVAADQLRRTVGVGLVGGGGVGDGAEFLLARVGDAPPLGVGGRGVGLGGVELVLLAVEAEGFAEAGFADVGSDGGRGG